MIPQDRWSRRLRKILRSALGPDLPPTEGGCWIVADAMIAAWGGRLGVVWDEDQFLEPAAHHVYVELAPGLLVDGDGVQTPAAMIEKALGWDGVFEPRLGPFNASALLGASTPPPFKGKARRRLIGKLKQLGPPPPKPRRNPPPKEGDPGVPRDARMRELWRMAITGDRQAAVAFELERARSLGRCPCEQACPPDVWPLHAQAEVDVDFEEHGGFRPRMNPDEDLRRLYRLAAEGGPDEREAYQRAAARAGMRRIIPVSWLSRDEKTIGTLVQIARHIGYGGDPWPIGRWGRVVQRPSITSVMVQVPGRPEVWQATAVYNWLVPPAPPPVPRVVRRRRHGRVHGYLEGEPHRNPPRCPYDRVVFSDYSGSLGKKRTAVFTGPRRRTVHFGAQGYEDYTMHHDPKRRARYIQRHGRGREDWDRCDTAGSLSRWVLWGPSTSRDENERLFRQRFGINPPSALQRVRRAVGRGRECYPAAEVVYHASGGKQAGLTPMQQRHEGVSHWWVRGPRGEVLDPAAQQFTRPVPYGRGRGRGFLTKKPSRRARALARRAGVKMNPGYDRRLRDLERQAAQGDPGAEAALEASLIRLHGGLDELERFYFDHMGYAYRTGSGLIERIKAKVENAKETAEGVRVARDIGWAVIWEPDDHLAGYELPTPGNTFWQATLYDSASEEPIPEEMIAHLGGIEMPRDDFPDDGHGILHGRAPRNLRRDPYWDVVEAELVMEALSERGGSPS